MTDGLEFVIYDKADAFRRQITGLTASVDLVANGISVAELTLDDDDVALAYLTARGARCAVRFRDAERMRGRVRKLAGTGPDGQLTFSIESDHRKLWEWLGWPVPAADIDHQDTAEYARYTGPSETVFKTALADAIDRLGVPWTVATDLGRGEETRVELRFHPLADKLLPALIRDDLVVVITYGSSGPIVDVREAAMVAGALTPASGIADAFGYAKNAPQGTRVVSGGAGEGTARQFALVVDAALEDDWGDIIEGFVDARMSDEGADLTVDAIEKLRELAPTSGVNVDLVETDRFLFGTTFDVGDLVQVLVGPVDELQQITTVSITENPDDGVVVTPRLGDQPDETTDVETAEAVERLARGVRDQGRR